MKSYFSTGRGFNIALLLFILLFTQCADDDEYYATVKIIFKNDTNYNIKYYTKSEKDKILKFSLAPYKEFEFELDFMIFNPELDTCCYNVLYIFNKGKPSVILKFDDKKCITFKDGEGPTTSNFVNFENKKLGRLNYQNTYRFTEDHYKQAVKCK